MSDQSQAPRRYNLSTSNKVMLILFGSCAAAVYYMRHGIQPEAFAANVRGLSLTLLSFVIFPGCCSWFIWLITGRRKNGGSWTYNLMLLLVALGLVGSFLKQVQQGGNVRYEVTGDKEQGRTITHVPEADAVRTVESKDSDEAVDREVAAILRDLNEHVSGVVRTWSASWEALQRQHFIDVAGLTSEKEFRQQRQVVAEFLSASESYRKAIAMLGPEAERELSALGTNQRAVQGLIEGIEISRARYSPYAKVLDAHIEYAGKLNAILDFLERENGKWRVENKNIVFFSAVNSDEWQRMFSSLVQLERQITRMGASLPAEGHGGTSRGKTEVATSAEPETQTSRERSEPKPAPEEQEGASGSLTDAERARLRELKEAVERGREIQKNLSDIEKEVIDVMFGYHEEFDLKFNAWTNSAMTVMATPARAYSGMKDESSVEHWRSVIETYNSNAVEFLVFLKAAPRQYEGRLMALESSHPAVIAALTDLRAHFQHSIQFKDYVVKSSEYGKQLSAMLDFLENRIVQRGSRYGNAEAIGNVERVPDWKKLVREATKTESELVLMEKKITDALARN